jgi:GT2 family glycosyltransferase
MVKISIITATYNKLSLTQEFWASLLLYQPLVSWEIIWVDDGSTDDTRDWLRSFSATRHQIIYNEKNLGYAGSNNAGAAIAKGDILVFLNNDTVLTRDWFRPLYDKINELKYVGVVGNVQMSPDNKLIDHAGVKFDLVGVPVHYLKNRTAHSLRGNGIFSNAVTAACWLVRRDVFRDNGGFDESYRNGAEDIDFCIRLGQAGYRHWVDYRSIIWHHVSSSPGRKDHDLKNQALFLRRWSHITSVWGQSDWPLDYILRILRNPKQTNATKATDAILRLLHLRKGDSSWALLRREKLMRLA